MNILRLDAEIDGVFRRRLPELREQRLVERRVIRKCSVGGRRAHAWWPVEGGVS